MSIEQNVYQKRREKLAAVMRKQGIAAARFDDFEHMRSPSIRYLCGHPGDAFLVVDSSGASVLVAWDKVMAEKMASVDQIFAYTDFGRRSETAIRRVLETLGIPKGTKIELPSATPYLRYVDHVAALEEWDLVCRNDGMDEVLLSMRSVKDEGELQIYKRLSSLTNTLIGEIEAGVRRGSLATESEIALFIEKEARGAGAEGTGFDTIAAGPERSFGIHAFPSYGAGSFGGRGFSILDFGVVIDGYTSDVTMSFVRGPLDPRQEKMLGLVQEAYKEGLAACGPKVAARQPALLVDQLFAQAGFSMPHSLGHGIGLEAHEAPGLNLREENNAVLEPGMIVTVEPGLYHPELGGIRWENDVLISETGATVLTESNIVIL